MRPMQSGMEIAYRTGYNPKGLVRVLHMLRKKEEKQKRKAHGFLHIRRFRNAFQSAIKHLKKYPDADELAEVKKRFAEYRRTL